MLWILVHVRPYYNGSSKTFCDGKLDLNVIDKDTLEPFVKNFHSLTSTSGRASMTICRSI